jgi:GNAT superfamily N-acetyltransferase
MSYTYSPERLDEARPELDALIVDHYREVAHYQDKIALAPMWKTYEALERSGELILMCCRKEGVLIGYACWFLKNHLHYADCLCAYNDVIYLAPEQRRGRVGLRLIDESEYLLKCLGVDRILWHVKPSHDWSPVLKRKGYQLEELILGKYTGQ